MSARLSDVEALAKMLAEHEPRWTTHGWERPYEVIHCGGDCDWQLRRKAVMRDDDCYDAHREHIATILAARLAEIEAERDEAVRQMVAQVTAARSRAEEANTALADLRAAVEELADEWERYPAPLRKRAGDGKRAADLMDRREANTWAVAAGRLRALLAQQHDGGAS